MARILLYKPKALLAGLYLIWGGSSFVRTIYPSNYQTWVTEFISPGTASIPTALAVLPFRLLSRSRDKKVLPTKPAYKVPELPVAMLEVIKRHPMKPKDYDLDDEFLYGLPEDEILLEDLEDIDEI